MYDTSGQEPERLSDVLGIGLYFVSGIVSAVDAVYAELLGEECGWIKFIESLI